MRGPSRLALLGDDAVQLRMGGGEVDELADQQLGDGQLVDPAEPLCPGGQRPVELGEQPVDGGLPQLVLRAEVVVQQRLGDPRPAPRCSRVVAPSNDSSENRSSAAARIRSRVASAEGRGARLAVAA